MWYSRESVEALAKDCELHQFTGCSSDLEKTQKIIVEEEIPRSESDYKELSQEYAKFFKK